MFTKLKLQIDLSNDMDIDSSGTLLEEYSVYITFLDKDERFNADKMGDMLSHNGTGSFVIKTVWDERMGGIMHNGLIIPTMDRLGNRHLRIFKNDMERYNYLKKLYVAVLEWANYWKGFKYDDESFLEVKDNIWEVTCDTIYTGSITQIGADFVDEFDNEFEDEFDNDDEQWMFL